MTNDTNGLRTVVEAIIASRQGDERPNPAAIRYRSLGKASAAELELAAHLQLRQIARQACRKQFDDEDDDSLDPDQQGLFPGLQSRYPAAQPPPLREGSLARE